MTVSANAGRHLLAEKDFVDVVDENDKVVGSAPKHWDETYLAPGTRLKKRAATRSGNSSGSTPPPPPSGKPADPNGSAGQQS